MITTPDHADTLAALDAAFATFAASIAAVLARHTETLEQTIDALETIALGYETDDDPPTRPACHHCGLAWMDPDTDAPLYCDRCEDEYRRDRDS